MKILSNLRVNSTGSFFIIFCLFEKNFNVDIYKSMWLYRNTCQIQNERDTREDNSNNINIKGPTCL